MNAAAAQMAITGSRSDWLSASVRLAWPNRAKTNISAEAPKPNVMICKNHECDVMNEKPSTRCSTRPEF
ncbi:hypothetical protein [Glutamicibacter sp.]|uniref:hypothetical protein n=1 Tax=Glutamicibacter sp. TaxID=1931995 RepID=UPI002B474603|nr:hypothetical protein [Glutamicibacter sp.]HJX77653.1 hypothetical protein [Glutamicibacter sp.]